MRGIGLWPNRRPPLSDKRFPLIPASGPMNAPLCMRSSRRKWSTSNIVGLVIALTPAVKIPQSGSTRCVSARVDQLCRATRTGRSRDQRKRISKPAYAEGHTRLNALMARWVKGTLYPRSEADPTNRQLCSQNYPLRRCNVARQDERSKVDPNMSRTHNSISFMGLGSLCYALY